MCLSILCKRTDFLKCLSPHLTNRGPKGSRDSSRCSCWHKISLLCVPAEILKHLQKQRLTVRLHVHWKTQADTTLQYKHLTLKSFFRDVLLPWETPAATTAPEWIMGPSCEKRADVGSKCQLKVPLTPSDWCYYTFPTARPPATEQITPKTFTTRVCGCQQENHWRSHFYSEWNSCCFVFL